MAMAVTDYITVQPITVCSTGPTTCAPFNPFGQTGPTAPVGYVDPATGLNITRAIYNQIGIDVTFLPAVQDLNAGSLSTLHVTTDPTSGLLTSADFKTLSQQSGISQGAQPKSPLNPNPTTMNLFFVNTLVPATPGLLYGFSWLNNNGSAIGSNTFGVKVGVITLPGRPDTIAHEIGHMFDLDHTTFGAGAPTNLMTSGDTRTEPSAAIVGGHAAWVNQIYPNGTLDQLTLPQPGQATSQLEKILKSGFINPIPLVTATIADPPVGFTYHVAFDGLGTPGESLDRLTLTLPNGFFFNDGFQYLDGVQPTQAVVNPVSCQSGQNCLQLDFAAGAFELGDFLDYSIIVCRGTAGPNSRCGTVQLSDLIGGTYTYQFSDLFETTGDLAAGLSGELTSNSQDPNPDIPSQIVSPLSFVGASTKPCTALPDGSCPPLSLEDADPATEGGQIPEPPSIAILLAAIGSVLLLHSPLWRQRGIVPSPII